MSKRETLYVIYDPATGTFEFPVTRLGVRHPIELKIKS